MSFQSEIHGRFTLRLAVPTDSADIKQIFESGSFAGGMSVQFLRGDDPIASFAADGDRAEILVAEDRLIKRVIAVGAAVVRTEFLDGEPAKTAYLTGLKVHRDYQGKLRFIQRAYAVMGSLVSDCGAVYTTILDGNEKAIKMLGKRRKNMPEYRFSGHYTTFCLGRGKSVTRLEKNNTSGFEELLKNHFSQKDLSPCLTDYGGFGRKDFFCIRDGSGEIQACCFIGDQSATKSYRMVSYSGAYRLVAKLPTALLGYPSFPREGEMIKYGVISYLYIKNNSTELCSSFLRSAAHDSGFDMLLWGCTDTDPLFGCLKKLRTVRYGSRLYEVIFDGGKPRIGGSVGMEAALL